MKYTFGEYDESKIIKNFELSEKDGKKLITINFLSGNSYTLPGTFDNVCRIENKVKRQALERSKYHPYPDVSLTEYLQNENNKYALLALMDVFSLTMMATYGSNIKANTMSEIIGKIIAGALAAFIIYDLNKIKNNYKEQKEVEKYDMFLAIEKVLFTESQLGNINLTERERKLNINNIDDYSLKEVKCLKKKLDISDIFAEYYHK